MSETYLITDEGGSPVATGTFRDLFAGVKAAVGGPDADFLASRRAHVLHGAPSYDPDTHYPEASAPYLDGETWRNETLTAYTEAELAARAVTALAAAKAVKREALSAEFHARREAGVLVGGDRYATSNDGHQELKALVERLASKGGTQKAKTRAGKLINLTLAQAEAIFAAVDDYIAACWTREYDLDAAITAATTKAEVDAIDITTGWPE